MKSIQPNETNYRPMELLRDERVLLACLIDDGKCNFSIPSSTNTHEGPPIIRGEFIAALLSGRINGFSPPLSGITIYWASIFGDINLRGQTLNCPLHLENCFISGELDLSFSKVRNLVLTGTFVKHLNICEIEVSGSIILNYGFHTPTPVLGRGAIIEGQLGCSGGKFSGTPLAITLEAAQIKEAFFWRFIKGLQGVLDLTSASVGTLVDDRQSWPDCGKLRIAGFTYQSLAGNTNSSFYDRLDWLKRQFEDHLKVDFRPQPFEQLKKVLEKSGRDSEAKKIAIQKLHYQRNANFLRRNSRVVDLKLQVKLAGTLTNKLVLLNEISTEEKLNFKNFLSLIKASIAWSKSYLFWVTSGYGYRPLYCLFWSVLILFIGSGCYQYQFDQGNIILLENANGVNVGTPFYPFIFAADTYIPFIDLGQTSKWLLKEVPNQKVQPFLILHWLFTFLGWFFAAIFGASVTGLVRK